VAAVEYRLLVNDCARSGAGSSHHHPWHHPSSSFRDQCDDEDEEEIETEIQQASPVCTAADTCEPRSGAILLEKTNDPLCVVELWQRSTGTRHRGCTAGAPFKLWWL
jgi:hypothetical protein